MRIKNAAELQIIFKGEELNVCNRKAVCFSVTFSIVYALANRASYVDWLPALLSEEKRLFYIIFSNFSVIP